MSSRYPAVKIIVSWLKEDLFPDRQLEEVRTHRAYTLEATLGVIRHFRTLEWIRTQLAPRQPDPLDHACLLVGLYEIFFMDNAEAYGTVNDLVGLVKPGGEKKAGFLNAVLRRVLREKEELLKALALQSIGIRHSHPDLLVNRWTQAYGSNDIEAMCKANNQPAHTVLSLRTSKQSMASYLELLTKQGIKVTPHPFAPQTCLILGRGIMVQKVPGFEEGWFYIQDPATQLAAEMMTLKQGDCVLDACAAPGGKTALLSDLVGPSGQVVAADLHADRLSRLRENIQRLALTNVKVAKADARSPYNIARIGPGNYDAILLDVPCTNTGVLRRRPDARWRFSEERLAQQVETQRNILDATSPLIRPGGCLVYSTCSIEPEEGQGMVDTWVAEHPAFTVTKTRFLFPHKEDTDGAFVARIEHANPKAST